MPTVLLDGELAVVAANPAYLEVTERYLEDLLGRRLTEAFPDNPGDPSANGVRNLTASLERVLRSGRTHNMVVQRYDVASSRLGGAFVQKVWSPLNSPIIDSDGAVVGIRHRVEDVTAAVRAAELPSEWDVAGQLGDHLGALARATRRARTSHEALAGENHRLADALAAVVSSRRQGLDSVAAARRRQLWAMVMRRGALATWRGWSHALCVTAVGWAEHLEDLDHTVGQGPATAAFSTRAPVVVDDLSTESARWPWYSRAVAETGLTGAAAFPVQTDAGIVGVLTLYARGQHSLAPGDVTDAALLADLAATVLVTDLDAVTALDDSGSSNYVAMATGMIAAQLGVGLDEALSVLRAHAFSSGRPINAVADDVVNRRIRLE